MDARHVLVCSFHTSDDYYREHADRLRKELADLGVDSEIEEVTAGPGEDWADICRKKIAFIGRVCDRHPDKKVFWIDVDCHLLDLPAFVADFSADLIGFQRGFGRPSSIGYGTRTRFWEPCFFGINTTPAARTFIADAVRLESKLTFKATDDYFFEESWRSNCDSLSFQVIPSGTVAGKPNHGLTAFFSFGSSGNVEEFKSKVAQHERLTTARGRTVTSVRQRALDTAKALERWLTAHAGPVARLLRKASDRLGVTSALVDRKDDRGESSKRRALVEAMVAAGKQGEPARVRHIAAELDASAVTSDVELSAKRVAESFAHYATEGTKKRSVPLVWWSKPYPGNFGDWISPMVLQNATNRSITYLSPTQPIFQPHLMMIGSIGRFTRPGSVVVGTGISGEDVELCRTARYPSVRGPVTAAALKRQGGPSVESFGDPGALLSRLVPMERGETNGRIALVRHFSHASLPLKLPEHVDELSVLMSHPDDIRSFVASLVGYDAVITSAMHVMIACHSYGIPCALVTFKGFEDAVHGTGIKYRDYAEGVGLTSQWTPTVVDLDLRRTTWDDVIEHQTIAAAELDRIEVSIKAAVKECLKLRRDEDL